MRRAEIHAVIPNTKADQVFDTISDFERYAELVEVVRSVTIGKSDEDGQLVSTWEVYFRNGILTWTEADWLRRDELRIDFEQTTGDFDQMAGSWVLEQHGGDVTVFFCSDFDFGIPSLASIIDPVAQRVLIETIQLILRRLFGSVHFPTGELVVTAAREGLAT